MKKKKVLIFIDWYLPGYKAGGPVQSVANLVAHLKEEADFSVVTRDTDYCEALPYESVKSDEWNLLPDGTRVYYFSAAELKRMNVGKLIEEEEFDIAYLNGPFSLQFTIYPLFFLKGKKEVRVVVAGRGMFAKSALGIKRRKKKLFLSIARMYGLFKGVVFHATNAKEEEDIRAEMGEHTKILIAGNLPKPSGKRELSKREKGPVLKLVNVARIAPEKNLLYALQVLKEVKAAVEFDIYGPVYDAEYWKECQAALKELPANVKVSYSGSLDPSKVAGVLETHHFMFMPTRGENFGHIILQSLSEGCPVIISDKTPWKQLQAVKAGYDLSLEDARGFAQVIDQCAAMTQEAYQQYCEGAFRLAKEYSEDKTIKEQYRDLFIL